MCLMMACVLDDGNTSDPFPVSVVLSDADGCLQGYFPGIPIRYRCDGKLFNPRRLQAVNKVKDTVIRDLVFADDCAMNANYEQEMHLEMDGFSTAYDNFGFTVNTKKTEVMYQPAPGNPYQEPNITVKGQRLQAVENFTYIGSTLSRSANIDAEVTNRIAKTSSTFGKLKKSVWERQGISHRTKVKVYRAVVLTTLLYTAMKPGLYIGDMRNNSTSSSSGVYAVSSTSAGRTRSRTPRCWRGHSSPTSSPPCARHRHAGQVTYPECQTPEYPNSCCTVNLVKRQGKQEGSASASKTP